ncbi:MAG: CAP domain-containing protein [Miltoncostaeaceae bacterium]
MAEHIAMSGRALRRATAVALLAGVALAGATTAAPAGAALAPSVVRACPGAEAEPRTASPRALAATTVCLVNRIRVQRRLPRLRPQRSLDAFAQGFARRMVRQRFFDHDVPGGPTFSQRARASTYARAARRMAMGENLAWGQGSYSTPAAIVESWMRSPGHRANILNRTFRDIGVGFVPGVPQAGGRSGASGTYVHAFGRRVARR